MDAIALIEALPRLTQIYNSIKEIPKDSNIKVFEELTEDELISIQDTEILIPTNPCFIAPELNLIESTVRLIQLKDNVILYELKYPSSLKFNQKNINAANNTIVQIYAKEFLNTKTNEYMQVIRTSEFFSPYIYSFKTSVFDEDKNLGIAYLMNSQSRIHLQNDSGIPYNYSITEIGKKLIPNILDIYIVA
jgi:hypothetical protein